MVHKRVKFGPRSGARPYKTFSRSPLPPGGGGGGKRESRTAKKRKELESGKALAMISDFLGFARILSVRLLYIYNAAA